MFPFDDVIMQATGGHKVQGRYNVIFVDTIWLKKHGFWGVKGQLDVCKTIIASHNKNLRY